jgi:membrane-associated phospholipid phosphatase
MGKMTPGQKKTAAALLKHSAASGKLHPMNKTKMKYSILLIVMSSLVCVNLYSEDAPVPLSTIFHDMGWNALHSVTYNYGLNFIGAAAGTWAFIETGADWQWNRAAYHDATLATAGLPALYVGYVVPALTPVSLYVAGRLRGDARLQITGMALTQSLMLTLGIQSLLKISTGRALPGIVDDLDQYRSVDTADFSGEFDWFNMNAIGGWPSGHTANAFAAAATIAELYKGNTPLTIAVYSYAALIGLGVSLNVHWASDVLAGALIGYAVGKTVGRSFNRLLTGASESKIAFYITPNTVGITARF